MTDFSNTAFLAPAFDTIMKNVIMPQDLKNELRTETLHLEKEGISSRKFYADLLWDKPWSWPEFEKWKVVFDKQKMYPYIWRHSGMFQKDIAINTIEDLAPHILVKVMREKLKEKGCYPKPAPRKRIEFESLFAKHVQFEEMQHIAKAIEDKKNKEADRMRRAAPAIILSHHIMKTGYSLRDQEAPYLNTARLLADITGDCPVEAHFARKYNAGIITSFPPFFPGDRTSLYRDRYATFL